MKRIRALEELTRTTNLLSHFCIPPPQKKKAHLLQGGHGQSPGRQPYWRVPRRQYSLERAHKSGVHRER